MLPQILMQTGKLSCALATDAAVNIQLVINRGQYSDGVEVHKVCVTALEQHFLLVFYILFSHWSPCLFL